MSTPDTPSDTGPAEVHARLAAITSALVAMIRQRTPTAGTSSVPPWAEVATASTERAGRP